MATAPVKSQPLHNFSLPFLKWGGTAKNNQNHNHPNSNHHHHHHRFRRPTPSDSSSQLPPSPDHPSEPDSEPHRLGSRTSRNNRFAFPPSSHHKHHHHQQQPPLCNDETDDEAGERKPDGEDAEAEVQKPWNLRPRKPVGPVMSIGARNGNGEVQEPVHSVGENPGPKSLRLRGETMQCGERKKEKKSKFWIALSKEEIEEDIFVMTGSRPSRRPKKRPKNVQKQMDSVFPGLWLVGVTADAYRVADTPAKEETEQLKMVLAEVERSCEADCSLGKRFRKVLGMVNGTWKLEWRLPYMVGGQSSKHIVNLQNPQFKYWVYYQRHCMLLSSGRGLCQKNPDEVES